MVLLESFSPVGLEAETCGYVGVSENQGYLIWGSL